MKKRTRKAVDVQKFGGVEDLGQVREENVMDAPVENVNYDLRSLEVESKTHLEDDMGYGKAAIVRCFEFAMNPMAFYEVQPTKQELFNYHVKGIEIALWKDGLKFLTDVEPRLKVDDKTMRYQIFVAAEPMKGHTLTERPQTLTEIAHG